MNYYRNENKKSLTLIPTTPNEMKVLIFSIVILSSILIISGIFGGFLNFFDYIDIDLKLMLLLPMLYSTGIGLALLIQHQKFRLVTEQLLFNQEVIEFSEKGISIRNKSDYKLKKTIDFSEIDNIRAKDVFIDSTSFVPTNIFNAFRFRIRKRKVLVIDVEMRNSEEITRIVLNKYTDKTKKQRLLQELIINFVSKTLLQFKEKQNPKQIRS